MYICTPNIRTPYCEKCFISVPPIPTVIEPPLCSLRAFYDAASENLSHAAFLHLVKKAQQNAGV